MEQDLGFASRTIVRTCRSGSIATTDRDAGTPYVSFCAYACDHEGMPVFLFSDLADHTQNIAKSNQVSLLCEQASGLANPQAGPRVTLVGQVEKITDQNLCLNFLQIHPSAKMYAQFGDFNFYRLNVEKAHYVGGFGRAVWVEGGAYAGDSAAFLNFSRSQSELLQQVNLQFGDFARVCATKLLKQRGRNWQVLRIDGDGIDLRLASKTVRYPFEKQLKTIDEIVTHIEEIGI